MNASDVLCATLGWLVCSLCAGRVRSTARSALQGGYALISLFSNLCDSRYKADICAVCGDGILAEDNTMTMVTCNGQTYHQGCYACTVRKDHFFTTRNHGISYV